MHHDIKHHPDWFVGLCTESTFRDVQAFFHKQRGNDGRTRCPQPCGAVTDRKACVRKPKSEEHDCHDAVKGEECYNHVIYTVKSLKDGIKQSHPDWYPGLSGRSSFKEVQALLHGQKACPKPCGSTEEADEDVDRRGGNAGDDEAEEAADPKLRKEKRKRKRKRVPQRDPEETTVAPKAEGKPEKEAEDCFTAQPGDGGCYDHVKWVKDRLKDGFTNHLCKGLTNESSVVDIQTCLYRDSSSRCKSPPCEPCPRPADGCSGERFVYQALDCDGDGTSDHLCTTTTNDHRWLVLSSEGCPKSWGANTRKASDCQAASADILDAASADLVA
jgi:hypothetical protein